ncbi:MAG TPA: hypothetical protein VME43_00455, partial [Bryobacteraceae bacterium]|nr:hypothetical protein [Bryobacteraceae bacterium]
MQAGSLQYTEHTRDLGHTGNRARTVRDWPVSIAPVLGANALQSAGWPTVAPSENPDGAGLAWLGGTTAFGCVDGLRLPTPILGRGVPTSGAAVRPLPHPEERILGPASGRGLDWLATGHSRRLPEMRLELVQETVQSAQEQTPQICRQWMPSPPAEAAEREVLPAVACWQDFAVPAPRLPELRLDEMVLAVQAMPQPFQQWVASAAAIAAEREVIPSIAARFVESGAVRLPEMRLEIAPTAIEPVADFRPQQLSGADAAIAIAGERMVQTASARLPEMRLEAESATLDQIPELCEQMMPVPPAQAAEREVTPSVAAEFVQSRSLRLPEMRLPIAAHSREPNNGLPFEPFSMPSGALATMGAEHAGRNGSGHLPEMLLAAEAETFELIPDSYEHPAPAPAAEAAEREVVAAMAESMAFGAIRLPELTLAVEAEAVEEIPEPCEQALPCLAAEAAEREVIAAMAGSVAFGAIRLPELTLAVEAEAVEQIPEPCEQALPSLAAEAAEREVIAAMAESVLVGAIRLPELTLAVEAEAVEQIP